MGGEGGLLGKSPGHLLAEPAGQALDPGQRFQTELPPLAWPAGLWCSRAQPVDMSERSTPPLRRRTARLGQEDGGGTGRL